LANLRQVLGDRETDPPFLSITPQTLQLEVSSGLWSDVAAFSELQPLCLRPPGSPLAQEAIDQMERDVALYRGHFLEEFSLSGSTAFEEWTLVNRERYRRLAMQTLRRLAAHYGRAGECELALQYAWRQVELDPWQEEAHRQVMRLLALNGQRCAALAQYETCRRLLHQELGIGPSEQMTKLYKRIRGKDRLDMPADVG
jgi:DNA-binding SARP family transcriptional activator